MFHFWADFILSVDRQAILKEVVLEVHEQMAQEVSIAAAQNSKIMSKYFKLSSDSAQAIGKARFKMEKMVKSAESRILEQEREEIISKMNGETMAKSFAKEIFHRPGTILTSNEMAFLSEASQCRAWTQENPRCNRQRRQRWRTASGICNNRADFLYGSVNTPMVRLIPAQYEDGISSPRGALQMSGSKLVPQPFAPPNPSARVVSTTILLDKEVNDTVHSLMLMQWGQFIDHDLSFMPEAEHCPTDNCNITEECAPIRVQNTDDNVETQNNGQCLKFHRTLGICSSGPELGPRENMNGISHFIDGSSIYHHDQIVQNRILRVRNAYLLNTSPGPAGNKL